MDFKIPNDEKILYEEMDAMGEENNVSKEDWRKTYNLVRERLRQSIFKNLIMESAMEDIKRKFENPTPEQKFIHTTQQNITISKTGFKNRNLNNVAVTVPVTRASSSTATVANLQQTTNGIRHEKIQEKTYNGFVYCSCGSKFKRTNSLLEHIRRSTLSCKFNCPICDLAIPTLFLRNKHLAQVHRVQPAAGEGKFGCGFCGAIFQSSSELIKHRHAEHSNRGSNYRDVRVPSTSTQRNFVLAEPNHQNITDDNDYDETSSSEVHEDIDDSISCTTDGENQHECTDCDRNFPSLADHIQHYENEHLSGRVRNNTMYERQQYSRSATSGTAAQRSYSQRTANAFASNAAVIEASSEDSSDSVEFLTDAGPQERRQFHFSLSPENNNALALASTGTHAAQRSQNVKNRVLTQRVKSVKRQSPLGMPALKRISENQDRSSKRRGTEEDKRSPVPGCSYRQNMRSPMGALQQYLYEDSQSDLSS